MSLTPVRSNSRPEPVPAAQAARPIITIDHVSQRFQTKSRRDHLVLSDISLSIEEGAFLSILSPSAFGQSPLLYIFVGFISTSEATASMNGQPIKVRGPE